VYKFDDIHDQKRARMRGKTWAVGIYGDVDLVDNATGKVLDRAKGVKLLNLPKITRRYSYIVEGTEYQTDNQWRLKPGIYARQKANGELETQFNLSKGRGFRMGFDPARRKFLVSYGTANIPLLPVLQAMGVPDEDIRKAWGVVYREPPSGAPAELVSPYQVQDHEHSGQERDCAGHHHARHL